jgi:hypothetical protein
MFLDNASTPSWWLMTLYGRLILSLLGWLRTLTPTHLNILFTCQSLVYFYTHLISVLLALYLDFFAFLWSSNRLCFHTLVKHWSWMHFLVSLTYLMWSFIGITNIILSYLLFSIDIKGCHIWSKHSLLGHPHECLAFSSWR